MPIDLDEDERRELRVKARLALLSALEHRNGEAERASLLDRALAVGGFTPRELAAEPPEAAAGQYERLVDHHRSWALTNLRRDGLVENPRRGVWRLAGAVLETPSTEAETIASDHARPGVKLAVWRRDEGKCVEGGSRDNLHFDHVLPFSKGARLSSPRTCSCSARHNLQKSARIQ